MRKYIIFIILICIFIPTSGCIHAESTEIKYSTETALPTDNAWRCTFTDPELIKLIETALVQNADIRTANLNVDQADAELRAARLAWAPSLNIGIEGGISKSNGSPASYTYTIPVSMQWEANIYGQLHQTKSSEALFWSAAERVRAVQIQTIAAIAAQYYSLISLREQLAILQHNSEIAQQTLGVMEALKDAGLQTEAAISQARADALEITASECTLKQQIQTVQNALTLLIGTAPDLEASHQNIQTVHQDDVVSSSERLSELSMPFAHTIPLSRLSNRPDVRAAAYELQATIENIDIAQSAFYPAISFSATLGWTNNLGEIIHPGKVLFNLIGAIVQPLFNKGRNDANLRIARAQKEQALIAFEQSLLTASSELADALTAYQTSRQRMMIHMQQREAAQHAYDVSMALMRSGDATYLEVLTAQQSLQQNDLAIAADRLDIVQAQINLYKAIGGTDGEICQE